MSHVFQSYIRVCVCVCVGKLTPQSQSLWCVWVMLAHSHATWGWGCLRAMRGRTVLSPADVWGRGPLVRRGLTGKTVVCFLRAQNWCIGPLKRESLFLLHGVAHKDKFQLIIFTPELFFAYCWRDGKTIWISEAEHINHCPIATVLLLIKRQMFKASCYLCQAEEINFTVEDISKKIIWKILLFFFKRSGIFFDKADKKK